MIVPTDPSRGTWIVTASGRTFDLADPRPADVHPADIAHALSHVCRFGGHVRTFYSVAQHCVLVSRLVPADHALAGLLHDGAEAFVGDMVGPLKWRLPEFEAVERRVAAAVARRFGLDSAALHAPEVVAADLQALGAEARVLLPPPTRPWLELERVDALPAVLSVTPWSSRTARTAFLERLRDLRACGAPSET